MPRLLLWAAHCAGGYTSLYLNLDDPHPTLTLTQHRGPGPLGVSSITLSDDEVVRLIAAISAARAQSPPPAHSKESVE